MANETTFQPGDVVQLKSGGPLMTAYFVGDDEEAKVYCYFYKSDERLDNVSFPSIVLRKADVTATQATSPAQSPSTEAGGAI